MNENVSYIGEANAKRTPMDVLAQLMHEFPDMKAVYVIFREADGTVSRRTSPMCNAEALWALAIEQRQLLEQEK